MPRKCEMQEKIWKAMLYNDEFHYDLIRFYTKATIDYIKKYSAFLRKAGYIEKIGRKSVPPEGWKVTIWHVMPEYRDTMTAPEYRPNAKKP